MTTNTGGPAFPCTEENYRDPRWTSEGLSLRDYFAAKAMQARVSQPFPPEYKQVPREQLAEMIANLSYEMADAMLKARG
jgi:hypothetical protein